MGARFCTCLQSLKERSRQILLTLLDTWIVRLRRDEAPTNSDRYTRPVER